MRRGVSVDPARPFSARAWIAAAHRLGYRFRIGISDGGERQWHLRQPRVAGDPSFRLWRWLWPDVPGRGIESTRREVAVIDHLTRTLPVVAAHEGVLWSAWSKTGE